MASKSRDGWNSMPGQPRCCTTCGRKLRMTKDTIWFRTGPHVKESFCDQCVPRWRLVRAPYTYQGAA